MNFFRSAIFNGEETKIENFPYQATLITRTGKKICSAIVISEKYLLTARRCTCNGRENFTVTAGTTKREEDENVQRRYVTNVTNHLHYSSDIAILEVNEPFVFNQFVQSIKLPEMNADLEPETEVSICGWGKTTAAHNNTGVNVLRAAKIKTADWGLCRQPYYSRYNNTLMMCGHSGGSDACKGDEGGPMVKDNTLYGIISWGWICGNEIFPRVFTRVPYFIEWIRQNAKLP